MPPRFNGVTNPAGFRDGRICAAFSNCATSARRFPRCTARLQTRTVEIKLETFLSSISDVDRAKYRNSGLASLLAIKRAFGHIRLEDRLRIVW